MGLIEALREIVDGPDAGKCQAFNFTVRPKDWVRKIRYASEMSGCTYSILRDPETDEYLVIVTGTLAQLRECVDYLEALRRDRP